MTKIIKKLPAYARIVYASRRIIRPGVYSDYSADQRNDTQVSGGDQPNDRSGYLVTVRDGMAAQCGYVYDQSGQFLHGLSHKYRPRDPYKTLRRACEKATGGRPAFLRFKYFPGAVAVAAASTQRYYFHWMVDVLPRLEIIRTSGFNALVYIDDSQPFQRETINAIWPEAHIASIHSVPLVAADELIVPVHQVNVEKPFPEWVARFLRSNFPTDNPQVGHGAYPRRLYVVRNNATKRRLTNEEDIVELLQQYGFDALCMEDLSVSEQARHFSETEIIIAPHGGGLTNLVFAGRGGLCVELFGSVDSAVYRNMCTTLGIDYHRVKGSPRKSEYGGKHEDFYIEPQALVQKLEALGLSRRGDNEREYASS